MPTPKPGYEVTVKEHWESRQGALKNLETALRVDIPEILKDISLDEAVLVRRSNFVAPPRRLAFMKAADAIVLLLMESGNQPIQINILIDVMLENGVCMLTSNPKSSIRKSFSWKSVQKMLAIDKELLEFIRRKEKGEFPTGRVSIAKAYYEQQVRKKK